MNAAPRPDRPDRRSREWRSPHAQRNRAARADAPQAVAAAVAVFAQKSPDAASIDDFIEQAGVSRGTFYNHFRSIH
ncbi:TetR family transcriptional regulator [Aquibium sp. ELW1220]|uniref:TetR family transcriptional regulator n=1 Tax=Aquibium sp. ELW1220 TaxID=2976766 RepID=UPI0025AFFE61|nr:TetR family transcriptional regulator [Aquibium sp. ELW1220]MDN2580953.1 TetR/AcrR family transcriptional regulator [Aquibium sp. ELW1220]